MDDLISRQAAIEALMVRGKELRNINWYDKPYAEGECKGIDYALEIVNALPSVQPERKKGKWIHIRTEADGNALYECSECHMGEVHVPIVEVKYCWNCGAKMEADKTDGAS